MVLTSNGNTAGGDDTLTIAGKTFRTRLFMGTGKWRDSAEMMAAFEAADVEVITVALRRIDFDDPKSRSILEDIDWQKYTILPNTAGCATAEEAIRVARMARAMGLSDCVKLEVIPDTKYLLPDPIGTLQAAETLVKEGFVVLPYINADPVLAKRLEEVGTATVMPLASPIGSGLGLTNPYTLEMIRAQLTVPLIVDAGIGTASDAAQAMELGFDGVLLNTAVAKSRDPIRMAAAMRHAVEGGRLAYQAGRIPKRRYAEPSSPFAGLINA